MICGCPRRKGDGRTVNKYKRLMLNICLFSVNSFATKIISFILVPLYTTYMSAGEYGITDMSLTVINLITPVVTLDISESVVRFLVGDRARTSQYVAVAFFIVFLSIPLVGLFSPLLNTPITGSLGEYQALFVLAYASSALMSVCGSIARGMGKVRIIPICASVSSLITLASALVFIGRMNMRIVGYFLSVSAGPLFAVFAYLSFGGLASEAISGARKLLSDGKSEAISLLKPMIRYAAPLIPNALFWWVGTSINRFFITGMLGITESGMFAAASKIPNLLNTVYSVFQQAWQLSAFQEADESGVERFYSIIWCVISAGLTSFCAILAFSAPLLASFFLRGETYEAWPLVPMMLLANLFNIFNSFYGTVYTSTMHTSFIMKTTVIGALLCAIFTPALIVPAGIYGAAIASILGQGVVFVLRAYDSRKYIAFDAGAFALILTLLFLFVQSAATALGIPHWRIVSLGCLLLVLAIQGMRVFFKVKGEMFR